MKNQLVSFIRQLFAIAYSLFSTPQRARLIVAGIAICLIVAALLIPSLPIIAGAVAIGGH